MVTRKEISSQGIEGEMRGGEYNMIIAYVRIAEQGWGIGSQGIEGEMRGGGGYKHSRVTQF